MFTEFRQTKKGRGLPTGSHFHCKRFFMAPKGPDSHTGHKGQRGQSPRVLGVWPGISLLSLLLLSLVLADFCDSGQESRLFPPCASQNVQGFAMVTMSKSQSLPSLISVSCKSLFLAHNSSSSQPRTQALLEPTPSGMLLSYILILCSL